MLLPSQSEAIFDTVLTPETMHEALNELAKAQIDTDSKLDAVREEVTKWLAGIETLLEKLASHS